MKNRTHLFLSLGLACILSLGFVSGSQAQDLKIGYTNVSYILSLMPEGKQVEKELQTYSEQLDKELQKKYAEYQQKMEAYQRGSSTMPDAIKKDKERELMNLEQSIQQFQQDAETSMQKKQAKLLEPITKKISTAIDKVADEKGYTYVFNSDAGFGTTQILLHAPDSDNVTEAVLQELGLEIPEDVEAETNK